MIALLFRAVLSTAAPRPRRARYTADTAFGKLVTTASTSPPVTMSATAYRRPTAVAAISMTVLAPTTAISAASAATASRQVPGRGLIASASSVSSSWTAATSHRIHRAGNRRRSIRARRIPSTATYGTSTTAASPSPATGATTAATVSRHTAATHTAGTPDRTTTRRWKPIHPATTAASPSSAARLNTFDPMITPAPTLACPRASAVTAEVISGASAASAATSPSHASENPARSPSRSSRETSSQLAARLTTTPTQNSRIPGTQTSCGVGGGKR